MCGNGTPGGIRTPDLEIRSLPLYPAELRARISETTTGTAECEQYLWADALSMERRTGLEPATISLEG